jgi:hypothetical protein
MLCWGTDTCCAIDANASTGVRPIGSAKWSGEKVMANNKDNYAQDGAIAKIPFRDGSNVKTPTKPPPADPKKK